MPYAEYKAKYHEYQTVLGSYSARDKTIQVELPDDVEYEPDKSFEELKWHKVRISENNVSYFDSYVLIKLPYRSDYRHFTICVSRKLVRKDGGMVALSVREDYTFKAKKKGRGRYNKSEAIEEKELSADDIIDIFGCSVYDQEEPELHTPEILQPEIVEALEELIDADD